MRGFAIKLAVFREPRPTKIVLSETSGRATPIGVPISQAHRSMIGRRLRRPTNHLSLITNHFFAIAACAAAKRATGNRNGLQLT